MQHYLQLSFISLILSSFAPLVFARNFSFAKLSGFVLLIISGIFVTFVGFDTVISQSISIYKLQSLFPYLLLQFQLDPLSGFFLGIIGIVTICAGIYGIGYLQHEANVNRVKRIMFFTGIFIASMYLVLLAHDVFSFMLAWELMSISSYFLVIANNEIAANRHAAFLYFIMAHAGGLFILFAYSILVKFSGSFDFSSMHAVHLTQSWTTLAFLFAFAGFGMKAGLLPFHIWLPEAHPAAPSHISALMSGVMLKVAIYGFIRFVFYLLGNINWQWGMIVLVIGSASALFGILYALMQNDLKKMLAYSSIDNIGIIFIALGLSMIFIGTGHNLLGALGLIAALYHCLNHAIFKSLLFFGAGTILQQTHEHSLEKMGGLIHKMPYTALLFLVGCISISALPPFNGFVSEWLIFQTALQSMLLKSGILRIIVPIAAALLALTSVLVSVAFVKLYGVAFLGKPRSHNVKHCKDTKVTMLFGMGILALLCLLLGVLPGVLLGFINIISSYLLNVQLVNTHNWLWLVPINANVSSYNAPIVFVVILLTIIFVYFLCVICRTKTQIVDKPWECGFGGLNSRMQYTATAFAMPLRRVFSGAWLVKESIDKNNKHIDYKLEIMDWLVRYIYDPIAKLLLVVTKKLSLIQGGNIRVYLIYIFVTLLILLMVVS